MNKERPDVLAPRLTKGLVASWILKRAFWHLGLDIHLAFELWHLTLERRGSRSGVIKEKIFQSVQISY
jgi:hypothetical protein